VFFIIIIVVVYFVIDSVRKLLDTPSYILVFNKDPHNIEVLLVKECVNNRYGKRNGVELASHDMYMCVCVCVCVCHNFEYTFS
jgi:hypothetical protein